MGSADWKVANTRVAGGFTKDVKVCPRCETEHVGLPYRPLSNPKDDWAFYATCPITGEPILAAAVQEAGTLTPQEERARREEE